MSDRQIQVSCVYLCVCASARVRACVRACVHERVSEWVSDINYVQEHNILSTPYHVSSPLQFLSYSNLPGPSAHSSYTGILPSVKIPSGTHHKFCNDFQRQHNQPPQNPYSEFTPSPQHSTSTSSSSPLTHVTLWWKHFVTINRFRTVRATSDILWLYILIFVTKKKLYLRSTANIRQVSYMILCRCAWYNKG